MDIPPLVSPPSALNSVLVILITSIGLNLSPQVFLGSFLLALFGAALGAIWLEHASTRERSMTVLAGVFGALLVVLGHENFLPSWSVQLKALFAGLVGRYVVAFILQGAAQVVNQSATIVNSYLEKLGDSSDE